MSEKRIQKIEGYLEGGYQAKIDKPPGPGKPPTGGSNVKPPSNSSKKTQ